MSEKLMQISVTDFLNSLKEGYIEYKECAAEGSDQIDLAKIAGFCTTMEQILSSYGRITDAEIKAIKEPILGNIALTRGKKGFKISDIDLEMPTILRRQQD